MNTAGDPTPGFMASESGGLMTLLSATDANISKQIFCRDTHVEDIDEDVKRGFGDGIRQWCRGDENMIT